MENVHGLCDTCSSHIPKGWKCEKGHSGPLLGGIVYGCGGHSEILHWEDRCKQLEVLLLNVIGTYEGAVRFLESSEEARACVYLRANKVKLIKQLVALGVNLDD